MTATMLLNEPKCALDHALKSLISFFLITNLLLHCLWAIVYSAFIRPLKNLQTPGGSALPCHSLITQQAEIQLDGATEDTVQFRFGQ